MGIITRGCGDDDPYFVQYEDGDSEEMTTDEANKCLAEDESTWVTVKHLYGEILETKLTKTSVGKKKKATMMAWLYVRWDRAI